MRNILTIARRELGGYFSTPLAYIFIVIFLALLGGLGFYVGRFFERGQASLDAFFTFHPWLYLFLIPAISMRLWAEERKSGSIELLMTLPLGITEAVVGKFVAAWLFSGAALALTFPYWITVNLLGDPDNGAICAAYLGSFLMAGAFLAIGSCLSALTKNQVIAFVLTVAVCFLYTMSGLDLVLEFFRSWAPSVVSQAVASMSFLNHFGLVSKGVLPLATLLFYLSTILFWLFATTIVLDLKKD